MNNMSLAVAPPVRTIVVYSDLWCSFAHIAIHRLRRTRNRLGLDGVVAFDLHAFPLELLNDAPSPRPGTDSEVALMGSVEPEAGWQLWQAKDWLYPSTTLPALEAILAAKGQGLDASERLDWALRQALWAHSRCISNRAVILDCARQAEIDAKQLADDLDRGTCRGALSDDAALSATDTIRCSPHIFLPDGSDFANPGMQVGWNGKYGIGFPVLVEDNPDVYETILRSAASPVATNEPTVHHSEISV
jgi:predicted DsbA family dithiol-disulfide isomerase